MKWIKFASMHILHILSLKIICNCRNIKGPQVPWDAPHAHEPLVTLRLHHTDDSAESPSRRGKMAHFSELLPNAEHLLMALPNCASHPNPQGPTQVKFAHPWLPVSAKQITVKQKQSSLNMKKKKGILNRALMKWISLKEPLPKSIPPSRFPGGNLSYTYFGWDHLSHKSVGSRRAWTCVLWSLLYIQLWPDSKYEGMNEQAKEIRHKFIICKGTHAFCFTYCWVKNPLESLSGSFNISTLSHKISMTSWSPVTTSSTRHCNHARQGLRVGLWFPSSPLNYKMRYSTP